MRHHAPCRAEARRKRARHSFCARLSVSMTAVAWPVAAAAHTGLSAQGFVSGLLHPVFGVDHFLAMLSVGIVSAQLGGRRIWLVPTIFVSGMIVGAIAGIEGIAWPRSELGIALSVLLLGMAVTIVNRWSGGLSVMLVTALFGSLHGNAHGLEMPRAADPVFYAAGFLVSTIAIHLLGVLIGHTLTTRKDLLLWLRCMGACIAVAGLVILVR